MNPFAIEAMREIGIDISGQHSKSCTAFLGESFNCLITVCDNARERCPIFPGALIRQHWPLTDPAAATGSHEERLAVFRSVRDDLRTRIAALVAQLHF